jgi:rhodanese-related sulfurtransferase
MKPEFPSGLPDAETTIEISPRAVAQWHSLPKEERPLLIDCREADELIICRIDGLEWIPLGEFSQRVEAIRADSERGVVVYCHHGMRSRRAADFLRAHGIKNTFSMSGGIDMWSDIIDASVPRY